MEIVNWRKSSRSGSNGGDCVELFGAPGTVVFRDSKNRTGPTLAFSRSAFRAFAAEVKRTQP